MKQWSRNNGRIVPSEIIWLALPKSKRTLRNFQTNISVLDFSPSRFQRLQHHRFVAPTKSPIHGHGTVLKTLVPTRPLQPDFSNGAEEMWKSFLPNGAPTTRWFTPENMQRQRGPRNKYIQWAHDVWHFGCFLVLHLGRYFVTPIDISVVSRFSRCRDLVPWVLIPEV